MQSDLWDPECFRDPLEAKAYLCGICNHVMQDPMITAQTKGEACGHEFCRSCIMTWLQKSKTCPIERQALRPEDMAPNGKSKREISALHVRCRSNRSECKFVAPLGRDGQAWRQHEETCKFVNRKICPYCHGLNPEKTHMPMCPEFPVSCPYLCDTKLTRKELQTHPCPNEPLPCPECEAEIPSFLMENHLQFNCLMVKVPCPFEIKGCKVEERRCNMKDHLLNKIEAHSRMLLGLDPVPVPPPQPEKELVYTWTLICPENAKTKIYSDVFTAFGSEWMIRYGSVVATAHSVPLFWKYTDTGHSCNRAFLRIHHPVTHAILSSRRVKQKNLDDDEEEMWHGWVNFMTTKTLEMHNVSVKSDQPLVVSFQMFGTVHI